jgi:hypothetical protein
MDLAAFRAQLGPELTAETAGNAFVELVGDSGRSGSFMLTAAGLTAAP